MVLRFLGLRTFSHGLDPNRTFGATAACSRTNSREQSGRGTDQLLHCSLSKQISHVETQVWA
jgi:hypothetical protein